MGHLRISSNQLQIAFSESVLICKCLVIELCRSSYPRKIQKLHEMHERQIMVKFGSFSCMFFTLLLMNKNRNLNSGRQFRLQRQTLITLFSVSAFFKKRVDYSHRLLSEIFSIHLNCSIFLQFWQCSFWQTTNYI